MGSVIVLSAKKEPRRGEENPNPCKSRIYRDFYFGRNAEKGIEKQVIRSSLVLKESTPAFRRMIAKAYARYTSNPSIAEISMDPGRVGHSAGKHCL